VILLGDREFGSVKLASWLCNKQVKFILRVKQGRYIRRFAKQFYDIIKDFFNGGVPSFNGFSQTLAKKTIKC
jgi:hypothetical protein